MRVSNDGAEEGAEGRDDGDDCVTKHRDGHPSSLHFSNQPTVAGFVLDRSQTHFQWTFPSYSDIAGLSNDDDVLKKP